MKTSIRSFRTFPCIEVQGSIRVRMLRLSKGGLLVLMLAIFPAMTTVHADVLVGPTTSNIQVSGTTVTATITPEISGDPAVFAAELFVDSVANDGNGTPMNLSGTSGPVTATGTLPTLPIGSTHTVFVHGEEVVPTDVYTWGAYNSILFTVDSTSVALPLGRADISLSDSVYAINLTPQDPCSPVDPCRVRSRFGTWNAADVLGYSRTTVPVPDGVLSLFTRVTIPTDPCAPTDPCRSRSFLIGFVATNGLKYDATTTGLLTTYTPR